MKRQLVAILTPLFFALPAVAADWPNVARTSFVAECVESTAQAHSAAKSQSFCECAANEVSKEFSTEELETIGDGEVDAAMQQRLIDASGSCLTLLED